MTKRLFSPACRQAGQFRPEDDQPLVEVRAHTFMYYVYFIKSLKNNKVYVGSTSKQNKPFELKYYESYFCKQDSLHREKFYKSGFGKKIKKAIIQTIDDKTVV